MNNDFLQIANKVKQLITLRTSLELYSDQINLAGKDGLDPIAKAIMATNLMRTVNEKGYGLESFDEGTLPATEDFSETIKKIGAKIMELIKRLIDKAKEYASKIMSGLATVTNKAEELIERSRGNRTKASNELHEGEQMVTINSPSILFSDGHFCLDDCKSEQEVIKFFIGPWPKYAVEQINRAKRMIDEYDVESGNSENFKANSAFMGNHKSLVSMIEGRILPGNKVIEFKDVALGPYLTDDENAKPAPDTYSYVARTSAEIQGTLRKNIATMAAVGKLFTEESNIYTQMATLAKSIAKLDSRRNETVWKSAREDLDTISTMMMDLIIRLKPNYEPIVTYLGRVGAARNAACQQELNLVG